MTGLAFAWLETPGGTVLSAALGRSVGLAFKAFRLSNLDGTLDEAFEGFESVTVVGRNETNCHSVHVGPTRPADSVDVVFGMGRKVKIDDVSDPIDVDAAGRDIGGDQNSDLSILEILQGASSLILTAVGVNGSRGYLVSTELPGYPVRSVLGPGENKDGVHFVVLQKMLEQIDFLRLWNFVNVLLDGIGRVRPTADLNGLRFVLELVGQLLDFLRKSGRKKKGLPALLGQILRYPSDIRKEAHVEHPVGFVENKEFQTGKVGAPLFHQVHQTAGRGYDEVDSVSKGLLLWTFPHSTVHRSHLEWEVLGVGFDVVVNLNDQFTGRRNDQCPRLAIARTFLLQALESSQHGQGESRGLAGSGLGNTDHVASIDNQGNGAGLNGSGFGISRLLDGL